MMIGFSTSTFAEKVDDMVKRNGLWYVQFSTTPANGQFEIYWNDGVQADGKLRNKGTYKDGKRDGIYEEYHMSNGALWTRVTYKDGKEEGIMEIFSDDGTLRSKCFYAKGKLFECAEVD